MKKIAHVLVLPKMAGSQKFCHMLLSKIEEYEKFVLVSECEDVDFEQRAEFIKNFESINVNVIWCKNLKRNIGKSDVKAFIELYNIFKQYDFDIVHTNSTKPGILARIAAKMAGVKKIIHTVHGISFYRGQPFIKRLIYWIIEVFALQFGDLNICVNKFYQKYYKIFFWKKSITIYNGYDFSEIKKINKMAKDSNEKRFLFVGRLDEQKDPLTLIKAFELIEKKYPNVYLDIVGDGELKGHCEELVKKLKIQDKVIFHGWVEKPYSFYLNCNVFICPSKYEAFGFIFVEAAYFKKPIITTSVEGIPEVVVDSKMGYLIKPGDFLDLSKRMTNLLESNSLCVAMGEYGHKYVTSNFDIEKCVEKYQAVYDDI